MVAESVELRPGWPGLQPDADEVRADPEVLEEVSRKLMAEHYAHLDGMTTGTLTFLGGERQDHAGWFGFWPTAEYMQRGLEDARVVIRDYYRALDTQVEAAAELFAKTAEEYREIEQGLRDRLEATVEGWDRLAPSDGAPAGLGPGAGGFEQSAPITGIPFTEDTSNYDADEIVARMNVLREQRPWGTLNLRATTFAHVADRLDGIANTVWTQARVLEEEWNSQTSAAAQRALQRLEATARHLADSSRRVAAYAERSATALEQAAHDFPEDAGVPWWDDLNEIHHHGGPKITAKHNEIREKLAALNETYAHINNYDLPTQVSANLPQLTDMPPPTNQEWDVSGHGGAGGGSYAPSIPPLDPSPPPGSGMAPTGTSSVGASDVGAGLPPGEEIGGSGFRETSDVDPADGSSGGLAGVAPGPAGGVPGGGASVGVGGLGAGGTGAGGAGVGGGSLPGGGLVPGGVGGRGAGGGRLSDGAGRFAAGGRGAAGAGGGVGGRGVGGGVVGAPIVGGGAGSGERSGRGRSGGVAGGRPAAGAGGAGAGAGAGGGTGRGVAGGMIPMGGAGLGSDQERSRSDSWLVEDDDPWKVDDDVPPGVIR